MSTTPVAATAMSAAISPRRSHLSQRRRDLRTAGVPPPDGGAVGGRTDVSSTSPAYARYVAQSSRREDPAMGYPSRNIQSGCAPSRTLGDVASGGVSDSARPVSRRRSGLSVL